MAGMLSEFAGFGEREEPSYRESRYDTPRMQSERPSWRFGAPERVTAPSVEHRSGAGSSRLSWRAAWGRCPRGPESHRRRSVVSHQRSAAEEPPARAGGSPAAGRAPLFGQIRKKEATSTRLPVFHA